MHSIRTRAVEIAVAEGRLSGDLNIPHKAEAVVLFAHGSGSSRHSLRNKHVAGILNASNFATLLFDLLTRDEELEDRITGKLRFNIDFLAERLIRAMSWLEQDGMTRKLKLGLFGASTGSAAALVAAAQHPQAVSAFVSRGGRSDLAQQHLRAVKTPTLLIVGELDEAVIELNQLAMQHMSCITKMKIVAGAGHLFEEPGGLEQVGALATSWFKQYLVPPTTFSTSETTVAR